MSTTPSAGDVVNKMTWEEFLALPPRQPSDGHYQTPIHATKRIFEHEFTDAEKKSTRSKEPSAQTLYNIYTALLEICNEFRPPNLRTVGPDKFRAAQVVIGRKRGMATNTVTCYLPILVSIGLVEVFKVKDAESFYAILSVPADNQSTTRNSATGVLYSAAGVLSPREPVCNTLQEGTTKNDYPENAPNGVPKSGSGVRKSYLVPPDKFWSDLRASTGFPSWLVNEVGNFPELIGIDEFTRKPRWWKKVVKNAGVSLEGQKIFLRCCKNLESRIKEAALVGGACPKIENPAAYLIDDWQTSSGGRFGSIGASRTRGDAPAHQKRSIRPSTSVASKNHVDAHA